MRGYFSRRLVGHGLFRMLLRLIRYRLVAGAALGLVATAAALAQQAPPANIETAADEIVGNFRRMIVLHESGNRARNVSQAGQYLFFRNRQLAAQLVADLLALPREQSVQRIAAFLALFARRGEWRDVDQLALLGAINETRVRLPAGDALAAQLAKAREQLMTVRAVYNEELSAALGARPLKPASRPGWDSYVAFLHERLPFTRVMEEIGAQLPAPAQRQTASPRGSVAGDKARRDEWTDGELPPRTVLLTFDDGPHPQFTAEILQILEHYGVKAVFFQVGQNLGAVREGRAELSRNAALTASILRGGHAVANHTYTHPLLSKLDVTQVEDEIDTTQALLVAAAGAERGRAPLFRPPYGARNPLVLAEAADRGLRSVLWNIDSRDWADPIPRSIAQRVVDEAEHEGRGIILFHDIHGRTVQALPLVLEELGKRGFRFARWDGTGLTVPEVVARTDKVCCVKEIK